MREFVEDNFLKIIFVKTKENVADIFTKNLPKELHNKHCDTIEEDLRKKFRRSLSKQEGCWNVPTGTISHD